MFDKKTRLEFKLLLAHALEGSLSPEGERRLHEIMLQYNPRYRNLRDDQWVDAGLILAGSWLLADALEAAASGLDARFGSPLIGTTGNSFTHSLRAQQQGPAIVKCVTVDLNRMDREVL